MAAKTGGMIVSVRTSATDPLEIAAIETGLPGRIGVTFAPGKQKDYAVSGTLRRDLGADLDAIVLWGAAAVVTLVEDPELEELKIPHLGREVRSRGLLWFHLPIRDYDIPGLAFEAAWPEDSARLRALLREGKHIVVHCQGGLGRSGMIAARLLVELGADPDRAMKKVRAARPGAIETPSQERWVAAGARRRRP